METEKEVKRLIANRLMRSDEEIENFEEAMNALYRVNDIDNIKFYCQAFDDNTEDRAVMFSLIHGIEAYDQIFGTDRATEKFLESIHFMKEKAKEWLETMVLRVLNDDASRKEMIQQVKLENISSENLMLLKQVIENLIKRNPNKFEANGIEVLNAF
ncbi:Imm30 family immunity protein [Zobellia roscoffensis]|uniref:Imm30 family immunity protein n=1 Tax=Zobellia roscoffensis TaxID=2779508 RepID=UPI00188B1EAA|nr:Imm30 family immunity protein [Zobellia roscoffensis]